MRIEIVVDRNAQRVWHGQLCARLARLLPDAVVRVRLEDGANALPSCVNHLLTLERVLARHPRPRLGDAAQLSEANSSAELTPDIVIDMTGREQPVSGVSGALLLRPLYNGCIGELAAIAALLAGSCPSIALENVKSAGLVATGLPSLEGADGLTGGIEAVASRMMALIERTLLTPGEMTEHATAPPAHAASNNVPAYLLRKIAQACASRLYGLCCYAPHWRIGWRMIDGPGVLESGTLSGAAWRVLPDLGAAFSADPFPVEWRGRNFIFFEQLDHRIGKGTIFAQEIGASGPLGAPCLVLEEPWHLSYPFLIVHNETLYMMPEASLSGAVAIYRCIEFPGKWECVGQLLSGIEAADATIFQHAGRFWMTSVVRDGVGGFSDTLAIHHAPDLFGPWEEHAQRPVLIDSRVARPAGGVVARDGVLWRPVQDCSNGYGKKLAIARIDTLGPDTFGQTVTHLLSPGPDWPGDRLHTLNRWGRIECIDGAVFTPRNLTLRRLTRARDAR